ncbi:MAG: hypothetical protein ABL971_00625 [Vicinamibacterales bacterium]
MKRTTVFVPEQVEQDLHHYARQDNRPTASLVREALEEYVARRRQPPSLPSFAAQFASGHAGTAEDTDAILFKALSPHGDQLKRKATARTRATTATKSRR